ncbi:MAG: hypothetical protein PHW65_06390 [Dehalococcoidales bacterium]|nr:hypothetical protein [Dehalococcoidales bacterium]
MGSERFLGQEIAKGINKVYDMVEKNKWPKVSIGQVKEYLGSEEFLGTGLWLWKEMRKK